MDRTSTPAEAACPLPSGPGDDFASMQQALSDLRAELRVLQARVDEMLAAQRARQGSGR